MMDVSRIIVTSDIRCCRRNDFHRHVRDSKPMNSSSNDFPSYAVYNTAESESTIIKLLVEKALFVAYSNLFSSSTSFLPFLSLFLIAGLDRCHLL